MNFGIIQTDGTSPSVVMLPATGSVTCSGAYLCSGTAAQGQFTATGGTGATVNISVSNAILSNGTGVQTLH